MPPLSLILGVLFALFLFARVRASVPCKSIRQLPFIADITHGICPKCGDSHPEKASFVQRPQQFWQRFDCRCGYFLQAHIEDRD